MEWYYFAATGAELIGLLLGRADRTAKRVMSADAQAWGDGALGAATKEIVGLAVSLALRCDDCVAYHLGGCRDAGAGGEEVMEAMGLACLIGGTITIPHLRRAVAMWNGMEARRSTGGEPGARHGVHAGRLQAVCDLLRASDPRFGWVGFYLVDPSEDGVLVLGPFSGKPTEHVRIPFGSGVCGRAASSLGTILVDDVSADPGYLACSPTVESEIVIPVFRDGRLVGELDIDSDTRAAFTEADAAFLERLAGCCSESVSEAASELRGGSDERRL